MSENEVIQPVFRAATRQDLPQIAAMLRDDPLGQGREIAPDDRSGAIDPAYLESFEALDRNPDHMVLAMDVDGRLGGSCIVSFLPGLSHGGGWRGQVEDVRVHRDLRGTGLGRAMLQHAVDLCRDRGCVLVQLTTNRARPDAQAFYDSLGFEPSHVGYKLYLDRG